MSGTLELHPPHYSSNPLYAMHRSSVVPPLQIHQHVTGRLVVAVVWWMCTYSVVRVRSVLRCPDAEFSSFLHYTVLNDDTDTMAAATKDRRWSSLV